MSEPTPIGREIGATMSVVLVAGVAGSGKTTVGEALAHRLGWAYSEADAFHPPENVAKMSAGMPLTDADRAPWLAKIATFIEEVCADDGHAVVTCSALKRAYRETLVGSRKDRVKIVLLDGTEDEIAARLSHREGHFMPAELLHSQFQTLERPQPEEHAVLVPISGTPEDTVSSIVDRLKATT